MRLRTGFTVRRAIEILNERAVAAANARSQTRPQLLSAYVEWTRETEAQFRSLFADTDMIDRLHSPRHWHIRAHGRTEDLVVGPAVFGDELEAQQRHLREAIDALDAFTHLAQHPGDVLVLDTNTMLHFRPLNDVRWCEEFDLSDVRLLIPLVVLDELDNKTYASSKQLAGRAETRLRLLDLHFEKAMSGGSEIRPGVILEILPDPLDHNRNTDVDHEILNRAEFVSQVINKPVLVVSSDRGMRVRGLSRGIAVKPLSANWRLPLAETDQPASPPRQVKEDKTKT